MKLAAVVLGLVACHAEDYLMYDWDDHRVLCSQSVDDLTVNDFPDRRIDSQLERARVHDQVALLHAHVPGITITYERIASLLDRIDAAGLDYVTFSELAPGEPRAGVALCFDDSAIDAWTAIRELLARHAARVTFFVTRYYDFSEAGRGELAALAADGHDIEPHAVNHLNARDYVAANGIDAYITDEVLPSIAVLQADGYPTTSFAYPFGASDDAIDTAVLAYVDRVRVSPGSCPF
ncbi:MAG: polysaccharide deacetylase family protein [Kofleriaceae bacterium]